jgi:ATP-dependent helicase/nuclease subunit A
MLRNEERKGTTAFSGAVEFIEELAEVREIEEMSLTPARENAVRLMNLHKAKGLEAPVVFLANPVGMKDHPVDKHVIRTKGIVPQGFFAFSKRGLYQGKILSQPMNWEKAAEEERKYEDAEEQRLMYVAATRARNMLVVSTYEGDLGDKRSWRTLDDALGDVPELETPTREKQHTKTLPLPSKLKTTFPPSSPLPSAGEEKGEEGRKKVVISKAEVERARKTIEANYKTAAAPTYLVESVTSLAEKERELPARRHDTGLGLSWGRLVHQALEAIGSGRLKLATTDQSKEDRARLELFIENMLAADEGDFSDKERLIAHIESILESEFWQRIMRAEKRYFEIPFSIRTSQRELAGTGKEEFWGQKKSAKAGRERAAGQKTEAGRKSDAGGAGDLPVILSGAIDLVLWEPAQDGQPAGWVIVDYKTDQVMPEGAKGDLDNLVNFYAPQIRLYTRFWSQITGEPVAECGLYFTSIHRWVDIPLSKTIGF